MADKTIHGPDQFVYLRIARVIENQILNGTLRLGDRLPSLRSISAEHGVSQNTALNVYYHLESKMLVESRPKSGFFVTYAATRSSMPETSSPSKIANYGTSELFVSKVYDNLGEGGNLPLSLATPANEFLPIAKLNKELVNATRELNGSGVSYDKVEGNERLRRQISRLAFSMECSLNPNDIITTGGCLNAISYCLMALTKKGDTVIMESPVSFGMLQLAQILGLKVLELPTHPITGIDLDAFEQALKRGATVSLLISNFSNPLGSCMPDENKKAVVQLSEKYNVPLIENDISADIYFGHFRPKSCKTYDESGIVLWCGSVSKTLAPGYRVGWVAPGRFSEQILRAKLYHSISSTAITQETVAGFLETGRYEAHLRKMRHVLHGNFLQFSAAIGNYFPDGTRITRPQGGFVLWVELPGSIDTVCLHEKAHKYNISFAPGRIFTLQNQYNSCMRLNYGLIWNEALNNQLMKLGSLAKAEI